MKMNKILFFCMICYMVLLSSCYENQNSIKTNNDKNKNSLIKKEEKDDSDMDTSQKNRLQFEKSPYLLQHASNPVDWYPWGEEAFKKASNEDKPIFLSIGYSTCHWCHVMEHESFEDTKVADLLNDSFVSIKVDREERPAIDHIYMSACQIMTGSGGWPLTIIMTPDKKPFFAGTYFPKDSTYNRIGMTDLLPQISKAWKNKRKDILKSADQLTNIIQKVSNNNLSGSIPENLPETAFKIMEESFDSEYGGFSGAPKFPTPHQLIFLLRYWQKSKNDYALVMVENTLQKMRNGGIFDHLGFGFHRYSTDREWLVPHFEKMVYDQALLMMAYTETYEATKKTEYEEVVKEIFTYISRDMTDQGGGFYTAEDADSEGEEGKFYVWSKQELAKVLSGAELKRSSNYFKVTEDGNYEVEATQRKNGTNILHISKSGQPDRSKEMDDIREKLFKYRKNRIHPLKDTKILTDWNGLMIAALAKAGKVFERKEYIDASEKAARFIISQMKNKKGRLLHRYKDGSAEIKGKLDDYNFMIWGLLELYEATFKVEYLKSAFELNKVLLKHFIDEKNGGFFMTADDAEKLIIRPKEIYDGAVPSGNSVAMMNFFKMSSLTGNQSYAEAGMKIADSFSESVQHSPTAHTMLLMALLFENYPPFEIVISVPEKAEESEVMLKILRNIYLPAKVIILRPENKDGTPPEICKFAKFAEAQEPLNGKTTVYICNNFGCLEPVITEEELIKVLKKASEPKK